MKLKVFNIKAFSEALKAIPTLVSTVWSKDKPARFGMTLEASQSPTELFTRAVYQPRKLCFSLKYFHSSSDGPSVQSMIGISRRAGPLPSLQSRLN